MGDTKNMNTLLNKFKQFFVNLAYFGQSEFKRPQKLPQGVEEFHAWAESIIAQYNLPDNDSVKFMLATMILHAKEDASYLSKEWFGLRALKSAANQVAAGVMQDLKEAQAARIKAETEAAKPAALTIVENECGAV